MDTYSLRQCDSVLSFERLNFIEDALFEINVARFNMLVELFDGDLHGLDRVHD